MLFNVLLNVLHDACIYPYIESTDFLILTQSIGRCMLYKGIAQKCLLSQIRDISNKFSAVHNHACVRVSGLHLEEWAVFVHTFSF